MTIRMCVLLWEHDGEGAGLHAYEDAVLPLLADHGGRLVSRHTVAPRQAGDPLEVQMIELHDRAALDAYLVDPRRLAREGQREQSIARTQILRLG